MWAESESVCLISAAKMVGNPEILTAEASRVARMGPEFRGQVGVLLAEYILKHPRYRPETVPPWLRHMVGHVRSGDTRETAGTVNFVLGPARSVLQAAKVLEMLSLVAGPVDRKILEERALLASVFLAGSESRSPATT